ncbi:MAG: hypothetical protein KAS12_07405 [Candidatus Aenigmarchaeota archaeon]|nr:hypothetical protein [Candidatus Aenigmarchaeota archaeon]
MALADSLVKNFGFKNCELLRAIIIEGHVKVNSQVIIDPEFPISSRDTIFVDEKYTKKSIGYWQFLELNRNLGLFLDSSDVIAASLNEGEIEYLQELNITISLVGMDNGSDKFLANMLILGNCDDIFNTFLIIEKSLNLLLKNAKVLIKVEKNKEFDARIETIKKLAELQKVEFVDAVKSKYSKEEYWVILTR